MDRMDLELIEVIWVYDAALGEWVLVAREPTPRGEPDGITDHWMKEMKEETDGV